MTDGTMAPLIIEWNMTPEEFKGWYARLGLKQTDLAARLDVDQAQVSRWLNGKQAPSGYLRLALERLEQILIEERRPKKRRRRPPRVAPEAE